jgi:hypothetical protein
MGHPAGGQIREGGVGGYFHLRVWGLFSRCWCGVCVQRGYLVSRLQLGGDVGTDRYIYRIQTWALEEARRRLEKEGILEDPSPVGGIVEKIVGK